MSTENHCLFWFKNGLRDNLIASKRLSGDVLPDAPSYCVLTYALVTQPFQLWLCTVGKAQGYLLPDSGKKRISLTKSDYT